MTGRSRARLGDGRLLRRAAARHVHGHDHQPAFDLGERVRGVFRNHDVIAFGNAVRCSAFELGSGAIFIIRPPLVLQPTADREDSRSIHHVHDLGFDIVDVGVGVDTLDTVFQVYVVGGRLQDRLTQQVLPAMAAKQQNMQTMLQTQIAIAERHPDLCACLNDQVIFLTGGSRTLPMPNLMSVTVEQADAMVARLRDG